MDTYQQVFEDAAEAQASAPGRVNMLGEHTDYNDGFVLPTAIPQRTCVQVGHSHDGRHHYYSEELGYQVDFADEAPAGFGRYVLGCVRMLERAGFEVPPLQVYIASTVPLGSGLSSSAALEVATLRALRRWLALPIDDVQIARLGQNAEREFAGVNSGIMDQMASSFADTEHLLFLDTRSLFWRTIPFPGGSEILVLDSGVPRTLAKSGYNIRRAECEAAARELGVTALRDIDDPERVERLAEPLRRRARHVVSENQRVLAAVESPSAAAFGRLMNASHASLRDDYEVSVPALDTLVELLQQTPGVWGARLTGAGFGGACVALIEVGKAPAVAQEVLGRYARAGYHGQLLVPAAVATLGLEN